MLKERILLGLGSPAGLRGRGPIGIKGSADICRTCFTYATLYRDRVFERNGLVNDQEVTTFCSMSGHDIILATGIRLIFG